MRNQDNALSCNPTLSDVEIIFIRAYGNIHTKLLSGEIDKQHAIKFIKSVQHTESLIKIAECAPAIERLCYDELMRDYWQCAWSLLGRYPTLHEASPENPYKPLSPQLGINCFDLVRGAWWFNRAKEKMKQANDSFDKVINQCLIKSADYGYYEALEALSFRAIKTMKQQHHFDEIENIKSKLALFIDLYGAPIYLLLTFIHFEQGRYHQQYENHMHAQAHYRESLKYLLAANLLWEKCNIVIKNVYYGRSFDAINPYQFSDFTAWKNAFVKYTDKSIRIVALKSARTFAKEAVEKYNDAQNKMLDYRLLERQNDFTKHTCFKH